MVSQHMNKNKFKAKKVEIDGLRFDSKLEAAVYGKLKLLEASGQIGSISHHPGTVFLTAARIQYRPDFLYTNTETGKTEYVEAKGMVTPIWALKKKLWKIFGGSLLHIYSGNYKNPKLVETIIPKGEKS